MTNEDLTTKLREYISYLDEKINYHRTRETPEENLNDSFFLNDFDIHKTIADSYTEARDRLYCFFPDLQPTDYRTLDDW